MPKIHFKFLSGPIRLAEDLFNFNTIKNKLKETNEYQSDSFYTGKDDLTIEPSPTTPYFDVVKDISLTFKRFLHLKTSKTGK